MRSERLEEQSDEALPILTGHPASVMDNSSFATRFARRCRFRFLVANTVLTS